MKKRIFSLLLACALMLSLMPAALAAETNTVQVGPYLFTLKSYGEATLTSYDSALATSDYADIPASVTDENGQEYPVTVIGSHAFEEATITGVTIPDSVTSLGEYSFAYCNSLSDVKLSKNLAYINDFAFASCDLLREITIPASMKEMYDPFPWCAMLETVYMEGMTAPVYTFHSYEGSGKVVFVVPQGATGYEDWSSRPFVHSVVYEGEPVPGYGLSLSPSTLDFGTILRHDDPGIKPVTVTNSGGRPVTLELPDDRSDWLFHWDSDYNWMGAPRRTLQPGESCTFLVEPRPGLDYGTHSETIPVTTREGISADLSLLLTVQVPNHGVTVSAEAIDFGAAEVGYTPPATLSFTITNEDSYPINLSMRTNLSHMLGMYIRNDFVFADEDVDGPIAPHESVVFTVHPAEGLKPGIYTTHVVGDLQVGLDTVQTFDVPVTFTVTAKGDLPSSWAVAQINQANAAGIVPVSFWGRYTQPATREDFCFLAALLYKKMTGSATYETHQLVKFSDTTDYDIMLMAGLGVVNGVGDGRFDPNGILTREQAATILARLADVLGHPLPQADLSFSDSASIASWAADGVGQVQAAGIMAGDGSTFLPQSPYTREQCILTVLRLYNLIQG